MPSFSFQDRSVFYAEEGRGPALLLIPGLGGRLSFWHELVSRLTPDFRVVSFDQPGYGQSEAPRGDIAVQGLAALAVALLDHLGIGRARLIGHSLGGAIAQVLALDYPERVASLVLSSSWAKSDEPFERAFAQRCEILRRDDLAAYVRAQTLAVLPPSIVAESPEIVARFERSAMEGAAPSHITLARIAALLAFDRSADLPRITQPVLTICCHDDRVVPPHMTRDLAGRIPGVRSREFPYGGHFAPLVAPEAFSDALLPFLDVGR